MKSKPSKKKVVKDDPMVCVCCGTTVSKCGENSMCRIFEHEEDVYFCGHCGEWGSHQKAVKRSKWIKARKLLGLSTEEFSCDCNY